MPAHSKTAKPSAGIAVIGIDIGKNVFHLINWPRSTRRYRHEGQALARPA
jgi:hypothetical protein